MAQTRTSTTVADGKNQPSDEGESSPGWQLHYWPNVPGRAEFIRLILIEAGQEFSELCDPEVTYRDFKCQQKTGWPVFAVPMIVKHGGFELGQTATICRYLAEQLDLLPEAELDRWRADQTCATVMDFITEGRLAFHGRNFYESYFGQEAETRPYIDYFERHRLPKFLRHFEQVLAFNAVNWNATDGKFVVGQRVSYCDICLLHVLRAAESQFPAAWAACVGECPRLADFKAGMEARPRIRDYLSSPRCKPFEGNSMM